MSASTAPIPAYEEIENELRRLHLTLDAAEYHGALCGFLCAEPGSDFAALNTRILQHFREEASAQNVGEGAVMMRHDIPARMAQQLIRLYQISEEQLDDAEFGFELLLPDEAENVATRTEALAAWCNGFLFGLTASGVSDFSRLSEDANEVLRDMVEISNVEAMSTNEESDEKALAEVIEYVRVGVLLIRTELLRGGGLGPSTTTH